MQSTLDLHSRDERSNRLPPHQIYLKQAKTEAQNLTAKRIVETFHSYVPTFRVFGRRINWLIYYGNKCVGVIGISDPTAFGQSGRDNFIGWTRDDRRQNIHKLATNYRFTLTEHIPNLASKTLGILVKIARKQWHEKYGTELVGIDTCIKPPREGTCYKAAGWVFCGFTRGENEVYYGRGVGLRKATFNEPLLVFFKPLVKDFRERLTEYNDVRYFFELNEKTSQTNLLGD